MMTAKLQSRLIELGWLGLTQRVLGGRPSESYALRQMMRCAGRDLSLQELAEDYEEHLQTGGAGPRSKGARSGSSGAMQQRIVRLREGLEDLGLHGVIKTAFAVGYRIDKGDIPRIEAAILFASGFDIDAEQVAA